MLRILRCTQDDKTQTACHPEPSEGSETNEAQKEWVC